MGHGRGQPDRLPLARPLARSPTRGEQGTRQVGRGHGTRATREDRPPVQPPPAWLPHPTPPHPAPTRSSGGGRRRGWEAEGNTDGRRHGEARAGGHGDGRAGRGAAGKGAQRRPGRETPPAGGNARAAARRTGAGGGGGRQAREQREEKPGGRPPTARGPPCLPLSPSTQPHARVRPRRPTTDGWLEAGRPTPWSDTKTPRARGHEAPRGHSPGGSARRRKDTAASRGPPPGHASPGRGHARDTASGRAARPDRARRCLGGARGAEGTPGGAADRGRELAGHRRHRRRRVGGARQTGGGGGPDSTPPPTSRGLPAARRGDSARRPHPTPGETHHAQKTACGARRLPKGRRRPRPTASARALWSVSSLSRAARAPPRPRSRRRPPPANPPHRPTRAPSSERAAGAGRGGVGCGADTAGGRGGAPVSALRGTKGTRRPCEDTPAAPPPERETPRGWRLIVKRRSDRRSPGRNPGPQVRSKCR